MMNDLENNKKDKSRGILYYLIERDMIRDRKIPENSEETYDTYSYLWDRNWSIPRRSGDFSNGLNDCNLVKREILPKIKFDTLSELK